MQMESKLEELGGGVAMGSSDATGGELAKGGTTPYRKGDKLRESHKTWSKVATKCKCKCKCGMCCVSAMAVVRVGQWC
jgi:hypothetical protein